MSVSTPAVGTPFNVFQGLRAGGKGNPVSFGSILATFTCSIKLTSAAPTAVVVKVFGAIHEEWESPTEIIEYTMTAPEIAAMTGSFVIRNIPLLYLSGSVVTLDGPGAVTLDCLGVA